jgi:hypothetical protein
LPGFPKRQTKVLLFLSLLSGFHQHDSDTNRDTQWVDYAEKLSFSQLSNWRKLLTFVFFLSSSSRFGNSAGLLATKGLISTEHPPVVST